jgi:transposase
MNGSVPSTPTTNLAEARSMLEELVTHCVGRTMSSEIQKIGKTIRYWFERIVNFHLARVSNGPAESLNNLIKRIKRIGFGFRNFKSYRNRALLYAGKPTARVLGSIVVRRGPEPR